MVQFFKDFTKATINAFIGALLCGILFGIEVTRETILSTIVVLLILKVYAYIFDHEPVYGTYVLKHNNENKDDER